MCRSSIFLDVLPNCRKWYCEWITSAFARGNVLRFAGGPNNDWTWKMRPWGACLSKEDIEEGQPPSECVATCKTTPEEDKNKNGVGKIMRAVWDARSSGYRHAHARQGKQRRERGLGFKEGTLALGTSMPGTVGTRGGAGGSIRSRSYYGTVE